MAEQKKLVNLKPHFDFELKLKEGVDKHDFLLALKARLDAFTGLLSKGISNGNASQVVVDRDFQGINIFFQGFNGQEAELSLYCPGIFPNQSEDYYRLVANMPWDSEIEMEEDLMTFARILQRFILPSLIM